MQALESSTSTFGQNGHSSDAVGSSSADGLASSTSYSNSSSSFTNVGSASAASAAMNAAQRAASTPAANVFADIGDLRNEFGDDEADFITSSSKPYGSSDVLFREGKGGTEEEPENEVYERGGDDDREYDEGEEEEGDVPLSTRELFGQLQQWFQTPGGANGDGIGGLPPEFEDDFDPNRNLAAPHGGGGLSAHTAHSGGGGTAHDPNPNEGTENGQFNRQHSHSWHHDGSSDGDAAGGGVSNGGVFSSGGNGGGVGDRSGNSGNASTASAAAAAGARAATVEPIAAASAAVAAAAAHAAGEAGAVTEAVADDLLAQFMEWVAGPRAPGSPPPPLEALRSQASSIGVGDGEGGSGEARAFRPVASANADTERRDEGNTEGRGGNHGPGSHHSGGSQHSDEVRRAYSIRELLI